MLHLPRIAASLLLILSFTAFADEPAAVVTVTVEKSGDGFIVSANTSLPASLRTAWTVLTDFDHMAGILSNLSTSRILQRNGNNLRVLQEGRAWYGPFFYSFSSEREIRLVPMKLIFSRQITGTTKYFESRMELSQHGESIQLSYQAEIVPGTTVAKTFGSTFVQHEVEEQLTALAAEISRKKTL